MIKVPHGNSGVLDQLRWYMSDRRLILVCPNGHHSFLADHQIASNGIVSPSCVCPWDGCGFHEYVTLVDWTPLT